MCRAFETLHLEQRVVEARQAADEKMPKKDENEANNTPDSKVIGMNAGIANAAARRR